MPDSSGQPAKSYLRKPRGNFTTPLLIAFAVGLVFSIVAAVRWKDQRASATDPAADHDAAPGRGGSFLFDPERAAIKAWLSENLNDGDYEIVKWYPAASLRGCRSYVGPHGGPLEINLRTSEQFWSGIEIDGRAVRLKFRSKNALGAMTLSDRVFFLDGASSVAEIHESIDWRAPNESTTDYRKRLARGL